MNHLALSSLVLLLISSSSFGGKVTITFQGDFQNVAIVNKFGQYLQCNFTLSEDDFKNQKGLTAATWLYENDRWITKGKARTINKTEIPHRNFLGLTYEINPAKVDGRPPTYFCEVHIATNDGATSKPQSTRLELPVIDLYYKKAQENLVRLEPDTCTARIEKISGLYSNPPLAARCSIVANHSSVAKYDYRSDKGAWNRTKYGSYSSWELLDKTIDVTYLHKYEADKIDLDCTWTYGRVEISKFNEKILLENQADYCGPNPLDSLHPKNRYIDDFGTVTVHGCFSGPVNISKTIFCSKKGSSYTVKCVNRHYIMFDGKKEHKYDEKMIKNFTDGCSAAASIWSSLLLISVLSSGTQLYRLL